MAGAAVALSAWQWLGLFGHFSMLSLLAIGGVMATAPDMHRYIVGEHGWLSDAQFTTSVAIGQASPGPNLLFVAVIGWNIAGLAGAAVTLVGILLPGAALTMLATRWAAQRRDSRGVRAFVAGMAPLTIGLVLASGWVLTDPSRRSPGAMGLVVATTLLVWRTRINPVWMVAVGAIVGAVFLR